MGKIAFVFSGQGDQYPGMGRELAEKYPAAAAVFEMCDLLRPGTSAQCFEGSEEELKETGNTQPCLFAMELAAAAVLTEKGVHPDVAAGFSLGEVTAAAFSGIFDSETGFRLVCRRGELMQREADKFDTSMAAVVKLAPEQVMTICGRYSGVYPVNFNCPGQITVSGLTGQMAGFFADIREAGGRAIPLKVRGAFHSPFMTEAAADFARELAAAELHRGSIPLYSDMTAEPYSENAAELLKDADGLVVPGGFGSRGLEGKMSAIRYARENGLPFLGLCLGMQMAVIEFARHELGLPMANTTEMDPDTPDPVIGLMEDQNLENLGHTMRLGKYRCELTPGTLSAKAYGETEIWERHRHRYEFNNAYRERFEKAGMIVAGRNPERDLVEIVELSNHPFFVAVQYHPEFKSRPNRPHPLFRDLVGAAVKHQKERNA